MSRAPVFVIGSPRSGTTWLQLLLAQHPGVATSQETHLFERYLAPLDEVWRWEATFEAEREIGLRPLLSEEEFHDLCRQFARGVLDRVGDARPDAGLIVEKTPGHVLSAPFIGALFPEACFVHVIRDPRAVVASLLRAGHGWGRRWAPRGAAMASAIWAEHVAAGRAIRSWTDRYHEIRYEELHERGPELLRSLLETLALTADPGWPEEAFEACSIGRLRQGDAGMHIPWAGSEPKGFYGRGERESWREDLSRAQLRAVEYLCSKLMAELGYARVTSVLRPTPGVRAHRALTRIHGAVDWRLKRAAARF